MSEMNEELMVKSFKFPEVMKLMPYANEAAHVRPNQLIFHVENQRGARDGIQRLNENNPELAAGVYYVGLVFSGKRYSYIGESGVSIFSRMASHCLKLLFRTQNTHFRRCVSETHGQLTQRQIREMFDKLRFKTQFDISNFIMDGTSVMKDEMLSLGQRIARRHRTFEEQKIFAQSIRIKVWQPPKKFKSQEEMRALTRLVETYFLRKYVSKMKRLPLLNVDDDQQDQIAKKRLDEFIKLYKDSSLKNDIIIDSLLETIKKTLA